MITSQLESELRQVWVAAFESLRAATDAATVQVTTDAGDTEAARPERTIQDRSPGMLRTIARAEPSTAVELRVPTSHLLVMAV